MNTECLLQGRIVDFQFIFRYENRSTGDVYFQVRDKDNNYSIVKGTGLKSGEMVFGSGILFRDHVDYSKEYFSYIVNTEFNPPFVGERYNNETEIELCNFGIKEKVSMQETWQLPPNDSYNPSNSLSIVQILSTIVIILCIILSVLIYRRILLRNKSSAN
ncbi:hypothetical protein LAT59_03050 [Candidatus Gracilibacteria bacterium]|nr:hypothetical protein [Candidatus Gracilibacteria bacterium]